MGYVEDYTARLKAIQEARVLASIPPPVASKTDIANMILRKARSDFSLQGPPQKSQKKKGLGGHLKSVGLGILDVLSTPQNMLVGAISDSPISPLYEEGDNPLKGAIKGAKENKDFIDYIQEAREKELRESGADEATIQQEMQKHRVGDFGTGLAADIVLDPLNVLFGAGAIKNVLTGPAKIAGKLKKADDVVEAAEDTARVAAASDEPAKVLGTLSETTPAVVEKAGLSPKIFEKVQKARVIDDSAKIVDQVAKGNPSAVDFLSIAKRDILPLSPVARASVASAVKSVQHQIKSPKFKATNFNPQVMNSLSTKLLNAARQQFSAETKIFKFDPKSFTPQLFDRYVQMVKHAEDEMIAVGDDAFIPKAGEHFLKYSDVLATLPPEMGMKAVVQNKIAPSVLIKAATGDKRALKSLNKYQGLKEAIENIDWTPMMTREYATRVIEGANKVSQSADDVASFIQAKMATISSDVQKAAVTEDIVDQSLKAFKKDMPATKAVAKDVFKSIHKGIVNPVPNVVQDIIDAHKAKLAQDVFDSSSKAGQAARMEVVAKATEEALNGATIVEAATDFKAAEIAAEAGIFSGVLKWIDPALGYKTLRPLLLENISARRASATTRAHDIIQLFSKVPENQHMLLWQAVKNSDFTPPPGAEMVTAQLQKLFHNMFGESGLADKFAGNTQISRAGINVEHLNKHVRIVGIKGFKFQTKVTDPVTGEKLTLNPDQILDTWKFYEPKDSKDLRIFAFNLTQAVENAMVEYSAFAQLGAMYGSKTAKAGYTAVSGMHPSIEGLHFPSELVGQIGKMAIGIDQFTDPLATGSFLKMYDSVLRTWKSGVTIYSPSHHIRNLIGDMFLGWMDGLSNPAYYTKAFQMMTSQYTRYSDIQAGKNPLRDLLGETREAEIVGEIIGQSGKKTPKGTRVIATAKVGKKRLPITIDQAYQLAFRKGLLPHSAVIEDLPGSETLMEQLANKFHPGKLGPFAPAKGQVAKKVRQASETREHTVRLAHWLYALENTKADSFEELLSKAAGRVRKYHPDGLDLTMTEKKVMRRLMPFYSWTRKAIPLIVEGLFTQPHKIMAYPKIMSGIQESQGIESSVSDPWPEDQLFPDWLSGNVIGPILPPDHPFAKAISRSDSEVGYTLINPGNPATDIMEDFFNNPIKGIGNQITPAIKLPAELAFGREFQSGAPIDDYTEYADKNIPLLAPFSRMTHGAVGTGLLEGGDLKGKETEPYNLPALLNWLTAAGILDTGRYIKGGEFDLRQRLAEERKRGNQ